MLDTLRMVFLSAAILCVLFFLLALKNKSERSSRWLIAALILAALGLSAIIVNNVRINGNKKALESSPVVSKALENATPFLLSGRTSEIQSNGQTIRDPYVLVPIDKVLNWQDRTKDSYEIINADSCWSGGEFITSEQADQCKTILFYETFVLEMPYQSTNGSRSTGKSESKTIYLYDVETSSIFGYERFDTHLPTITRGMPNLKVSTQTILDWVKEEMSKQILPDAALSRSGVRVPYAPHGNQPSITGG